MKFLMKRWLKKFWYFSNNLHILSQSKSKFQIPKSSLILFHCCKASLNLIETAEAGAELICEINSGVEQGVVSHECWSVLHFNRVIIIHWPETAGARRLEILDTEHRRRGAVLCEGRNWILNPNNSLHICKGNPIAEQINRKFIFYQNPTQCIFGCGVDKIQNLRIKCIQWRVLIFRAMLAGEGSRGLLEWVEHD